MSDADVSRLTDDELVHLIERVFAPTPEDGAIGILVDLPDGAREDHPDWHDRRELAAEWAVRLLGLADRLGRQTRFFAYPNVRTNNADLPEEMIEVSLGAVGEQERGNPIATVEVFRSCSILLAVTELSATAPLKVAAPQFGFRGATMPGFRRDMVPALRLDYSEVDRRCRVLKALLDEANEARLELAVGDEVHELFLDLRHRIGHASGGLIRQPGTAGNLPSGESYIVPYEGELEGDPSRSEGTLPVEFPDGIVVFRVRGNKAEAVSGEEPALSRERQYLADEPAYGNLAELGLGVLGDFGVEPTGEILLDEKLGLHIAFGRSDHFGGQVGPKDFSSPDKVVHIDRVYLPQTQPRVRVVRLVLELQGQEFELMRDDEWVMSFR